MKRLFIILVAAVALGWAGSALAQCSNTTVSGSSFVCVQTSNNGGASASITTTLTNHANGNILIAYVLVNHAPTPTITISNSAGGGYTWIAGAPICGNAGDSQYTQIFYAVVPSTFSGTDTFTAGASGASYTIVIAGEYSGESTSSPVTGSGACGFSGSGTSATSGAYAAATGNLAVGGIGCFNGGNAVGAGWTLRAQDTLPRILWEDQIVAAGSTTATGTCTGGAWYASIFTVNPAPPSGGQLISAPLLPQLTPSVVYPSEASYTITPVASGANLQTAITGAACGTVLSLIADGSWTDGGSNYTFPNTACACHTDSTKWVIIRSSAFVGGSTRAARVDPSAEYHNLAHITSTNGNSVFNGTSNGVSCYWFLGLDVYGTGSFSTIQFGAASVLTPANFPHDIVIDHSYIHGLPTVSIQRTVSWGGNWQSVVDSHISDAHYSGADAQAIVFADGNGPFLVQNSFLEGSTENTMSGGSAKLGFSSDFTFLNNHHFHPLSWSKYDPSYTGVQWVFKNNIEFKDGQRILVANSVFENMWPDGQHESEILNSNCSGSAPGINYVQDVTEYFNIFKNAPQWFVFGGCGFASTQPDHRIYLHDNLVTDMDACEPYGCGFNGMIPIGCNLLPFCAYDSWIVHNTISGVNYAQAVQFTDAFTSYGFQFRDNIFGSGTPPAFVGSTYSRVLGQAVAEGDATQAQNFPTGSFKNNCMYGPTGGTYTNAAFSGMQTPANAAAVFVNPGVDYHVSGSSVCHNAADDGTDMGANISAVNAATAGVVQTLANLHTVTNVSPSTFTHLGGTTITITGTNFINESGLGVIIGGAGPASTISTTACAVNTCTVVTSAPITLAVNDTVAVSGMAPQNGNAGLFTVASVTDTMHFTYTNTGVGTVNSTGGAAHRSSPGNACTSVSVVGPTSITCVTPAATGTVTNGPVSVFVSQWGIPVQSTVYGLYN